ncbi:MAG: hypothetical protein KDC85_18630 [Saprospiraceae bacterium]|nr:hypothetical protein [Saprospiraceae bacterium]MCB9322387.1 hypothetical protein [Lewinellaceae bacterium]
MLSIIPSLKAQIDTFDISQFILPEISRKSLNFSGTLNGETRNNSSVINTGNYTSQNLQASFFYSNFESDPGHQKITSGNFGVSLNYQNAAQDLNGQAVMDLLHNNVSIYYDQTNRNYYTSKRFYGVSANLSLINNFNSGVNNGNIRYYDNTLQSSLNIPLTFGFGRIEPVTDAWHAVRILADFETLGLLDHDPTHSDIYEMAEVLSQLRYERIFDSRLGRIRRIGTLDKYIEKTGLVKEHNSTYFTSLYDMYEYGIQAFRSSGERLTFGLAPEVSIYMFNEQIKTTSTGYGFFALVDYTFNYPIDQLWQLDINANFKGGYTWDTNIFRDIGLYLKPIVSVALGYYPNSRTYFNSTLTAGGVYGTAFNSDGQFTVYSSIAGNMYYYFSPRTALQLNLGYFYSQSGVSTVFSPISALDGFKFTYGINLTHAFY